MTRSLSFRATIEDHGSRLDSVLAQRGCYASRSAAAKMCDSGAVLVNGKAASKKQVIKEDDFVFYELPEEKVFKVEGQDIPLDVRFEDDDMMVIS